MARKQQAGGGGPLERNSSDSAPKPKTKQPAAPGVFSASERGSRNQAHKRHTIRLYGELCEHQELTDIARTLFVQEIVRSVPETLSSFGETVIPAYERTLNNLFEVPQLRFLVKPLIHSVRIREIFRLTELAAYGNLRRVILKWAGRHNLLSGGKVPEWVCDFVSELVNNYLQGTLASPRVFGPFGRARVLSGEIASVSFRSYDPSTERRVHAERRIGKLVQEYLDRTEADARKGGSDKRPEIRQSEHFIWAVRFQVAGESVPEIVASVATGRGPDSDIGERTVNYGIRRALDLVDLPRRQQKPGPKPPNSGN